MNHSTLTLLVAAAALLSLPACKFPTRMNMDSAYDGTKQRYFRIYTNLFNDGTREPIVNHIEECVVVGDQVTCTELQVKFTAPQ